MARYSQLAERMIMAGVLLLLVWLPIPLGSNRDWSMAFLVLVIGLLGTAWMTLQLFDPTELGRGFRKALLPLGLLVGAQCWVAIQWLFGLTQDGASTFQYLFLGLAYCLLYLLIISLFRTRKRLSLLLGVLVVSGVTQAFYGTLMTLSGVEWLLLEPKRFHIDSATGTYVNRNHLAGYLELTMGCGIGLLMALRAEGRFRWAGLFETLMGPKMRLRLGLVIMVIALVMSHSRMGNTAFFASLMLVGGIFVLIDKQNRLRNCLLLASILVIDTLVISQYFGLEQLKERIVGTRMSDVVVDGVVVEGANEYRGIVYSDALPLALEKPLLGQGAGSFEAVFPRFAGRDVPLHYDHAHNDFLQFFIEYGVLGMLPLALFVLTSLFYAFKAMRQEKSIYRSGVGFGAALGIIALMIHSFADFNLQIPANAATFVVVCATAMLANYHKVGSSQRSAVLEGGREPATASSQGSRAAAETV
ncbi:MAG TPA: O-antigen ligase family protein [Pseudomonas xinjiangensis]|uniref:O-antigen ligase family protein n=2 Tax=root TaxID=1 RepID=A0A7V1FTD4_9GAMM|nr:O-antigen ligase family protein [Halopseudomonas xinjiangensis]HEC47905.1 O-antigen ligase family protein [Halopseudomonas xinjiangensis]